MKKVVKYEKSFAFLYPNIAKEWHSTKNRIKPNEISGHSDEKVWWLYPYDDPITGKHFDFEWDARIKHRTRGQGCPFLTGKRIWLGFNDLRTRDPELAAQWHPTKNGDLTPETVMQYSNKKVWWFYPYDDPITGKHFDFEWEEKISNRSMKGYGCPFLNGQAVWPGFNDLRTRNPELAAQWHPIKNGDLTPEMVMQYSNKKVWWFYPYDDPVTGKHFDFEWPAYIVNRNRQPECPFLNGQAVWSGFNDLRTRDPELAAQWHPTANGDLTPEMVTQYSKKTVWWFYPYDDPVTGKHFDFEWSAVIYSRKSDCGCPFLCGKKAWKGFNDLATIRPELAKEWHPTKNRFVKMETLTKNSGKKVWWLCSNCGNEWRISVDSRAGGNNCPKCQRNNF